jgi:hypothetical protein
MGICKRFLTGVGLSAMMIAMDGCDSGDRIQDSTGTKVTIGATGLTDSSEFDRELIAAKTGNADWNRREAAIRAVFDKYGVAYPRTDASAPSPASGPGEGSAPVVPTAAKTAASAWSALRRDFNGVDNVFTVYDQIGVNPGQTLTVTAVGNAPNVDPFIVAFIKNGENFDVDHVRLLTYNDDISSTNRNAKISWTNYSQTWLDVQVVTFAYSPSSRGQATLSFSGAYNHVFSNATIGGSVQYSGLPVGTAPSNCYPSATWVWLNDAIPPIPNMGALVMDISAGKGGMILAEQGAPQPLTLPWIVDNHYPSFALVWTTPPGDGTHQWEFIQRDHYSCVN